MAVEISDEFSDYVNRESSHVGAHRYRINDMPPAAFSAQLPNAASSL